ncbi:MAG: bifunctional transaldolase/phosoglucose isomerase [Blastocatellia bacterium]|nr:bifunctional transaldolase/phosoglucose isomerase [Blastocatellia bacterium]
MTNPLVELQKLGQSIWYDNIRKALLVNGDLQAMIGYDTRGITSTLQSKIGGDDLRGVTSNPTIFEKAITGSTDYNEAMKKLISEGKEVKEIYEALAVADIQQAADLLYPVYLRTDGVDGYVSLEVSPKLALDTQGTIEEAKRLFATLNRRNVMIKIPATDEGLPAIEEVIYSGINVNVTLIFSEEYYVKVAEAYIRGLERRAAEGKSVDDIASVASFFVSRIDTAIDQKLRDRIRMTTDEEEKKELTTLLGKAAIANAKIAYQKFKAIFYGERFAALRAKDAKVQRPLWASTGTKDPAYSDVYYLEELIGSDTVNTVPPATYSAFRDHGKVRPSLEEDVEGAHDVIRKLGQFGINFDAVTQQLKDEGVKAFMSSFDTLFASIEAKRAAVLSGILDRFTPTLGSYAERVAERLKTAEKNNWVSKIWKKDSSLWKSEAEHQAIIKNALGWLTVPYMVYEHSQELEDFATSIRKAGFNHVLLLGMGGSSLCVEVFRQTFGKKEGSPTILVLDSTDPKTVSQLESQVDLASTLFIVASKSGSTTEPNAFFKYFYDKVKAVKGARTGENFVAITDPGTSMEQVAKEHDFRRIFLNPSDIGGRYSALSYFGMVPASIQGFDFRTLLDRADRISHACDGCVPINENPGARLGAIMGELAKAGRDKLTLIVAPEIASLGLWIEQLIAESTGKEGRGILPVSGEALGAPSAYANDRLFVQISLGSSIDADIDASLKALEAAGHPVVRHILNDKLDLGEQFFLWEFATAFAGAVLEINAFDQPNVQESKDNTKALLAHYAEHGSLPEQTLVASGNGLTIYADEKTKASFAGAEDAAAVVAAHLKQAKENDYCAILAYIDENANHDSLLQEIRTHLRDGLKVATTTGYGPRFLHSTGQLHKGGADNGLFIQITADDENDLQVPGEKYSFGVLKAAQALGDFQSLASRGRRAIRVHVGKDRKAGLESLLNLVRQSLPHKMGAN